MKRPRGTGPARAPSELIDEEALAQAEHIEEAVLPLERGIAGRCWHRWHSSADLGAAG